MTALYALFAILLAAFTGHGPTPAPHGVTAAPMAPAPAHEKAAGTTTPPGGTGARGRCCPSGPAHRTGARDYVNPGQWLDTPTPDDVQQQLPGETIGRAQG